MLNKGLTQTSTGAVVDVMQTVSSIAQGVTGTVETLSKALGTLNLKASAMYQKAEVDTKYDIIEHTHTSKTAAALRLAATKRAVKTELDADPALAELFLECSALFD
ncbi:hypothetical protein [Pantoea eucrina]|uniref:hypothetical protein n=1 Tax=Pantoea eucrina TaxID=472693 RepID=UPI00080F3D68|nr:hypothetical protein [Pantoea eucrina]